MNKLVPSDFETKSIGGLMKEGYKRSFAFIPFLVLLFSLQYVLYTQLTMTIENDRVETLLPIFQFFLDNLFVTVAFVFVGFVLITGSQPSALKHTAKKLGILITSSILYFVVVMSGTALLLIPGFLFSTWFYLYPYVITFEKATVIQSFKRSKQLLKGAFFKLFGLLLAFYFIRSFIYFLLTYFIPMDYASYLIATILTIPAEVMSVALFYLQQRSEKEALALEHFYKEVS